MSDSNTNRLEAVRTAIDAVLDSMSSGEYMTSYQIGDLAWRGGTPLQLLEVLRQEESILMARIATESRDGGAVRYGRFHNEPQ